ncbi:sugar transporter [Profundibacterium mesophilum]|uniref:Capsule polysaccharide export protein n=1 Tax=Profundibacterium mesophilum KAUST100406-0324 TaxID=1037889 RepID=A0A921NW03_9RHOB|nr:sugar transporter [Profundibacterium mesophilum]KAF0674588.1 Capsule polysaccharide export protein [Profundibacterium mesophilum KAUST100406-0324]
MHKDNSAAQAAPQAETDQPAQKTPGAAPGPDAGAASPPRPQGQAAQRPAGAPQKQWPAEGNAAGGGPGGGGHGGKPGGQWPGKQGQGGGQWQPKPPPPSPVVEVRPVAEPARMKRRHWGLVAGFMMLVTLPLAIAAYYLWEISVDQYASKTGFTVRQEEGGTATELLGGLAQFAGAGAGSDASILYEFIQSQEMVELINSELDLYAIYAQNWEQDPVFSLWPDATIEDLLWFWQRMVQISFDQSSGLIELRVLAFDPRDAQRIAEQIVGISQNMINDLNSAARADLTNYAAADLEQAFARLKSARQALTEFRTRTRIVDPEAEIQGQMGVVNNLQQQLAQALIELDLITGSSASGDPRVVQAERRIEVIRERIAQERGAFADDTPSGPNSDYPSLLAEYEGLVVDREFAEETYRAALAAADLARDKAARQSLYLATYVKPTLAQTSEYPRRVMLISLAALFLVMIWAIASLIYYSLRDRG